MMSFCIAGCIGPFIDIPIESELIQCRLPAEDGQNSVKVGRAFHSRTTGEIVRRVPPRQESIHIRPWLGFDFGIGNEPTDIDIFGCITEYRIFFNPCV